MSISIRNRIPGLRRSPRPSPFAPPTTPTATSETPEVLTGFEHDKAPSARAAKVTRIGFRCLIGLVAVLLLVNVIQNARAANRANTTPPTAEMSTDAARMVAATFASDYLSRDPMAKPVTGQDVLRQYLAPGGDPAQMSFTGTASLSTDMVAPGAVTQLDPSHAVVAVTARVTIGMPDDDKEVSPRDLHPSALPGRGANRPGLPKGYHLVATQWLPLAIPVVQTESGVLVDVPGPVFSAEPTPARAATDLGVDSTATEETRDWARTLFTSYALGSTQGAYLSAPNVTVTGLDGAVSVADIQAWRLSPPGPDGLRTGEARVGWTFGPAVDLAIAQSYTVTVQTSDSRWYVTSLGTSTTPTDPSN
jgi:hypothetical protein